MQEPALAYARTDFPLLDQNLTVGQALDVILEQGVGERIVYFYVVDEAECLVGVMPARRLLTTPRDQRLCDAMITRMVTLPRTATVYDACEYFVLYKFLAYPIIDEEKHVLGIVDVNLFTDEIVNLSDRDHLDDIFETIGFRFSEVRNASPLLAFRYRFPWLLATIGSGTIAALLAGAFEATLAQSLVLAFFLTLVLGLGESVSIQSMTVTIQALNVTAPTVKWYLGALKKEVLSAVLLGCGCGLLVALIVWLWQQAALASLTIGSSILLALIMACVIGLSIPSLLHALKLDPQIAAGPIVLALTDICTLLFYFSLAQALL